MKKIIVSLLLLFLCSLPAHSGSKLYGRGEIKLSHQMVDYFIKYLKERNFPHIFVVTNDGYSWAGYWTCSEGLNSCRPGADSEDVKLCEMKSKKECSVFAKLRKVVWNNGISLGNKNSRFKSNWTENQIKTKLTELGFFE